MIERQRLLELLEELRTGLSGMERVDDQTRSLLQGMTSDIERILEQEKPASREQLDPVHHDLKEMVLRFETEHPQLTGILGRIVDGLANLGI